MKINELKNKKILILGFAREGQDTLKFLKKLFPENILGIADKLELKKLEKEAQKLIQNKKYSKNIKLYLGENYLKSLRNYEIIIKSPGIPPKTIKPFINKKQIITSQTEIFFENCSNLIIGVAGTKGKGTTSSLIYQILKRGGLKVHLIGNIGTPVLLFLLKAKKDEIFVYELSSFQLMNLKKSPHISVILNSYRDHLDYHKDYKEYLEANANIARYQTKNDFLIYNYYDLFTKKIIKKFKGKKISIKGIYYNLNREAARTVGKLLKISNKDIKKAIEKFKSLPHRLEYVGKYQGINFYNDSLATIPEATIAALDVLKDKVETIILGGHERNADFKDLAKRVLVRNKIKNIILFPTTGKRIWNDIVKIHKNKNFIKLPRHFFVDNMKDAIKLAYQYTSKEKTCLLSCASASFSIFKDYRERGDLFKKYIKRYGQKQK